jgi:outer membrane cobalamin receptor
MRSLRLQLKIDNLLDADYEQVLGFSQPGINVCGGGAVNF